MMFGLTKPDETITVKPFEVFQKELVLTSSYINLIRSVARSSSSTLAARRILDGRQGASLDELGAILSDSALRAMGKYIIDPSK